MFQFPACPPLRLWIHLRVTVSSTAGFPHSDINGSMPACRSPLLFAACHVLLRRMVPGHPPCALCSLIFSSLDPETNCFSYSNWPFLNLSCFRCAVVKVRVDRALKTIQMRVRKSSFPLSLPLPAGFHSGVETANSLVTLSLPVLTFSVRIQLAIFVAFPPVHFRFGSFRSLRFPELIDLESAPAFPPSLSP